jgi:glycosyltransferase involved in cell wall biosynthesis
MGLPSEKVRTIYNAVDLERNRSGDATIAREALGIASDTPLVVFTSRLDHQKRPLDAVAAFRKVLYAVPDAHFAIVGRGDMEDQIRQRALEEGCSDRIHLVGFQSNVPDWLAAADAWYLPTESENFSLAVLEALAAGCPIASTPCQGNDEVLIHGENALLAPIGDIDAQARSIIQILENPDLRGRLALGAIETSHGYSSTRMLDEYEALYAECVGQ